MQSLLLVVLVVQSETALDLLFQVVKIETARGFYNQHDFLKLPSGSTSSINPSMLFSAKNISS